MQPAHILERAREKAQETAEKTGEAITKGVTEGWGKTKGTHACRGKSLVLLIIQAA